MLRFPLSLLLSAAILGQVFGLQPPDAEQWQDLLDNGNLKRRVTSAYRFENHIPGESLDNRAMVLRDKAMARSLGWANQLSRRLPEDRAVSRMVCRCTHF